MMGQDELARRRRHIHSGGSSCCRSHDPTLRSARTAVPKLEVARRVETASRETWR